MTQLDVSENDIEILDLSALDQLETLQCARNKIKEINLNGRVLRSLIAGFNGKLKVIFSQDFLRHTPFFSTSSPDLCKISVSPLPSILTHLDLSHNKFTALPDWIPHCNQLRTLYASHNNILHLPATLFTNPHTQLHAIHLDYNQIRTLPAMHSSANDALPLHELRLHNNRLEALPDDFFTACQRLGTLNVSSNRLRTLPPIVVGVAPPPRLQRLYATSNSLCDNAYDTLTALPHLSTLHVAYNRLNTFPDQCAHLWPRLEELILSGNNLLHLPDTLAALPRLRTLRVHSNRLQSVPALAATVALRTLDLAHNQLDRVNLVALVPQKLTFLDLSCNQRLQVDPRELQMCRAQRPMSLVDVSGRNRASLPAAPAAGGPINATMNIQTASITVTANAAPSGAYQENADYAPPWRIGFSETAGTSAAGRLYVSQLRLPCFCNSEGLFGLFDGESSHLRPTELVTAIPKILLEERTVKETAASYMRYTLLSAHRELRDKGQRHGVCALLCHVSMQQQQQQPTMPQTGDTDPLLAVAQRCRFVLRVASVGQAQAILIRRHSHVQLTPPSVQPPGPTKSTTTTAMAASATPNRQLGHAASYPLVLPDPEVCEIALNDQDEYLVLGNKRLWDVMSGDAIVREIRAESNVILAAKRLQDIAQSYGAEENVSVIVVQLANLSANSDRLMRELRTRLGESGRGGSTTTTTIVPMPSSLHDIAAGNGSASVVSGFCRCGCCCDSNNNCCHSGASMQFVRQSSQRSGAAAVDDRSSPSGQSDITEMSTIGAPTAAASYQRKFSVNDASSRRSSASAMNYDARRSLRNCSGIVRAVRARIEEEDDNNNEDEGVGAEGTGAGGNSNGGGGAESDSGLSEEQFKCWEYMLEQNTQLLFDKELNTISKGLTKGKNSSNHGPILPMKSLSLSSPQLADPRQSSDPGDDPTRPPTDAETMHSPRPVVAQYHASTPFLSRQFGSSRSFHPLPLPTAGLFKSLAGGRLMTGIGTDRGLPPLRPLGGPNAAYFGSLQRLMPYNLEYDFAAMRERLAVDESLEHDQRLQQYWGVATTEL